MHKRMSDLAQRAIVLRDLYNETMGNLCAECSKFADWNDFQLSDFGGDNLVLRRGQDEYDEAGFKAIRMDDYIEHIRIHGKMDEESYNNLLCYI